MLQIIRIATKFYCLKLGYLFLFITFHTMNTIVSEKMSYFERNQVVIDCILYILLRAYKNENDYS